MLCLIKHFFLCISLLASTIISSSSILVVGSYEVGDIWKCVLSLLGQSIFGNRLKSLLNIYSFLSTRFKVWNVIFRVTPLLGSLGRHGPVVQVNLVAEHNKREIVRVAWAGLDEELIPPAVQRLESVGRRHVVSEDAAICPAVESYTEGLESLLSRSVPDLHGHQSVVHHYLLSQEISPYGGFVLVGEFLVDILVHQRGFPDTGVPKNDHFE